MNAGNSRPDEKPRVGTRLRAATAAVAVGAVVVAGVMLPGYDARVTPVDNAFVWVLQTGTGKYYARVNMELGELDTVKKVQNPSRIIQTSAQALVYTDGGTRFATIDPVTPLDIDASAQDSMRETPSGTNSMVANGDYVAYLTDAGTVFAGEIGAAPTPFVPNEGEKAEDGTPRQFTADAIAVDAQGRLYVYSAVDGVVVTGNVADGTVLARGDVRVRLTGRPQLTAVNGIWALFDQGNGTLQLGQTGAVVETGTVDPAQALVQQPATSGDSVLIADSYGLVSVPLTEGTPARIVGVAGTNIGFPAAPAWSGQTACAAWLPSGTASGTLWTSDGGTKPLDYAGQPIGARPTPAFSSNGSRSVLNDTTSGWVWTVPDGALLRSSQAWTDDDQQDVSQNQEDNTQEVVQPKPPVAVDDAFGVRAGRDVVLPVLLNDSDPNSGDVITIDPASLTGLPSSFGTVRTAANNQELVVSVDPSATGTAKFTYLDTDGTTDDGLKSAPATVTLTVYPDSVNNPPVWCGVDGCLQQWPEPSVPAGGTVTTDVITGWVDPEGDPIYLQSASQGLSGVVIAQPEGSVVFRAPRAVENVLPVPIQVTVADHRGAAAERSLNLRVVATPQLSAESFAVVGTVGEPLTIFPLPHVTGAGGVVRLTAAKASTNSEVRVTQNTNAGSFTITGGTAGTHQVSYTVSDGSGQATGSVRVTLQERGKAALSVAPATAFVYPNQDTTIDLLSAVQNPAGLALMVTDVVPDPQQEMTMSVDSLGHGQLRISGNTDSGRSGVLGTVTFRVSDGSGDQAASVQGQLTVMMLASPLPQAPITVDDAVVTRAGVQVNIPVLANDVAPSGLSVALDPSKVSYDPAAGLAFASGTQLRYLAPETPGTYLVTYSAYSVGYPTLSSTAHVTITVLGKDASSTPQPSVLTAWVLAGKSVAIPFNPYAVDPNGDAVVLDKVLTQPRAGTANLSADGASIVYTSPSDLTGQVSFGYQVRNSSGATGASVVRVGVLSAQSDPSPVTYSDYVQVGRGAANTVVVYPAANDIDPTGGTLSIIKGEDGVKPFASADSPQYAALAGLIGTVDENQVTLRSSDRLGTYAFTYTVQNARGDQGIGMIVLRVVEGEVADYPVVTDTILTADEADAFPQGVDVLTGKVSWTGGDPSGLELALYGERSGVAASGWNISGSRLETAQLIPYEVSGVSFQGKKVTTYGFLQVPAAQPAKVILAIRADVQPKRVNEEETVEWDIARDLTVPAGQTVQLDAAGVRAGGVRRNATCERVGETTLRYTAGAGAPWADVCTVPVRLAGQEDWTYLAVPIVVIAKRSVPTLSSGSLTVVPSASGQFDLRQLTTWSGAPEWETLTYRLDCDQCGVGQTFEAPRLDGQMVTVRATDGAKPGVQQTVTVSLAGMPDVAPSALILKVGPAPGSNPVAGTVTPPVCSAGTGSTSCTFGVIAPDAAVSGQVNSIPTTPLRLVSVTKPATSCSWVDFAMAGDSTVTASWDASAPGGECIGQFVVEDAQKRQSLGGNIGEIRFRLNGLPAVPASASQVNYGDKSVTLEVVPAVGSSVPPVDHFVVYDKDGKAVATCDANGRCPAIDVAANNTKYDFTVKAVNSTGESRESVSANGVWAYRKQTVGSVSAAAPYNVTTTLRDSVTVILTFTVSDSEVTNYLIKDENGSEVAVAPAGSVGEVKTVRLEGVAPNQSHTYTVIPQLAGDLGAPVGNTPRPETSSASLTPAGLPIAGSIKITGVEDRALTVELAETNSNGGAALSVVYIAYPKSATKSPDWCQADATGAMVPPSGAGIVKATDSARISDLTPNRAYNVVACVSNGYGAVFSAEANAFTFDKAAATEAIRTQVTAAGYGYIIGPRVQDGSTYTWAVKPEPTLPLRITGDYSALKAQPAVLVSTDAGARPVVTVVYCDDERCTDPIELPPANPNAVMPQQVESKVIDDQTCVATNMAGGSYLPSADQLVSWAGGVPASVSYSAVVTYTMSAGAAIQLAASEPIPGESSARHAAKFTANIAFSFTDPELSALVLPQPITVSGTCGWHARDKVAPTVTLTLPSDSGQRTSADVSTANPVVIGVKVNAGSVIPGGNVTLFDGVSSRGTQSLANGETSFSLASLSEGVHQFRVVYTPVTVLDKDNYSEAEASGSYTIKASPRATTTTISVATENPRESSDIEVTVRVTATDGSTPIGAVAVYDNSSGVQLGSTQTLASGTASVTFSLTAGTYELRAEYSPEQPFVESTSSLKQLVVQSASSTGPR